MDWAKKHTDTVIILSGILSSFLWMNNKISTLTEEIHKVDKEIALIKTIMIMKDIYPKELALKDCTFIDGTSEEKILRK